MKKMPKTGLKNRFDDGKDIVKGVRILSDEGDDEDIGSMMCPAF